MPAEGHTPGGLSFLLALGKSVAKRQEKYDASSVIDIIQESYKKRSC